MNFNDREYSDIIGDLIKDAFYTDSSNRGKIAKIRQYSEILLRNILNIGSDKKIMLGELSKWLSEDNKKMAIQKLGTQIDWPEEHLRKYMVDVIEPIRILGNDATHTEYVKNFSVQEIQQVTQCLFKLYSCLFIKFFEKYPPSIYSESSNYNGYLFSYLPPIIRFNTYKYLYEYDRTNIAVVNKLCLSIIKTFDKEAAYKWLEKNKALINKIPYPSKQEILKYLRLAIIEVKQKDGSLEHYFGKYSLKFEEFNSIYDLLKDKINDKNTAINESGKMYSNFEQAKIYYIMNESNKIYETDECNEMNSLIYFTFMGRKNQELPKNIIKINF